MPTLPLTSTSQSLAAGNRPATDRRCPISLRLAELLSHHSRLSESIMLEPRSITHYFLVAYFGGFPLVIRNRRFVYRGADGEKLGGFVDRLQAAHPAARLLMTNDVPEDVRCGSELCIQVLPVMPEPDRSKPVFRPEVPREIRSYYETRCAHGPLAVIAPPVAADSLCPDQQRQSFLVLAAL